MIVTAVGQLPRREIGAQKPSYDRRTLALIEGPIAATLVRLAAPNVAVMLAQASVGLIEIYFIGRLGTDALAGVALVFPVVMLMQMMSAGAMGGGISSAIARRCSFVSVANTVELPQAFATAIDINPIGPQPVTNTVCPAIAPASTVCTAFPSGSRIAA